MGNLDCVAVVVLHAESPKICEIGPMSDLKKLTHSQLQHQLDALQVKLAGQPQAEDTLRLIEDLQLHQIELELQNRELRDTHRELEQARDRYADLYDFAPVGYLTLQPNGTILEINLTGARLLGTERSRILGMPLSTYLARGEQPNFFAHLDEVFSQPGRHATELKFRSPHGPPLYGRLESVVVPSQGDGVTCRSALLDVTDRRHAEKTLRKAYSELEEKVHVRTADLAAANESLHHSQAQLQALLDNTSAAIYLKDRCGRYLLTNCSYRNLIDENDKDLSGKTDYDFYPSDIADVLRAHDQQVLDASAPMTFDEHVRRGDREYDFVSIKFPLFQSEGGLYAVGGISTDITERVRVERKLRASEERLAHAQALSHVGSLDWAPQTGEQVWSDETFRIFGFEPDAFEPDYESFLNCVHPDDKAAAAQYFESVIRSGRMPELEIRVVRPDGAERIVRSHAEMLPASGKQGMHVICTLQDVTERKFADQALQQAAAVFENTDQGIIVTDSACRIIAVNPAFTRITGYSAEEVAGRNPRLLQSDRHDEDFYRALWRSLATTGHWQGEIWNRDKNGRIHPVWENITAVHENAARVINYVAVFSDISVIKEAEAQLQHLAHHDPLTGVPNRLLFEARLENAIQRAERHGSKVALMFLDLDRFKVVNDTLGHRSGDLLLKSVAHRLAGCVRAEDTVARLGGDEFTVVLDEIAHSEDAALIASKMLDAISQPNTLESHDIVTGASIGISIYPDDAENGQELCKAADAALYSAKQHGRGNYQFHTAELTAQAQDLLALEGDLRRALQQDEFVLYYQPQVAVESQRIVGVEALLRWRHPTLGLLMPDRFLGAAEETGLVDPITDWVLRTACAQTVAWQTEGLTALRVSVNMAPRTLLHDPTIVDKVRAALQESGLLPSQLELEITEKALQTQPKSVERLAELKAIGVTLAIDDFGTGYSCLGSLKQLPVDALKIDQSFVADIPTDPSGAAISTAVITMGHSLNLRIVAEGVAESRSFEFLRDNGCDEIQGYHFGRPVLAERISALLAEELVSASLPSPR